jgi:hypothetical protein
MYIYRPPVITILNDREVELVEPFIFEWNDPLPQQIVIPKGFTFDGASVPQLAWTLTGILPIGLPLGGAAVHDYTYQRKGRLIRDELKANHNGIWVPVAAVWPRKTCDDMFYRIMREASVTPWKSYAMYQSVRIFGQGPWDS